MKSYAFVFLTIMFALVACTGGGRMEAELSHIDSLAEADQSAAIAHIDSITVASGGGMGRFDSGVACPDDHHVIAS